MLSKQSESPRRNTLYAKKIRKLFTLLCTFFFASFLLIGGIYLQQKSALKNKNFKQSLKQAERIKTELPDKINRLLKKTSAEEPAFLHQLREIVYQFELDESGYAVIFDENTKIIHHPNLELALTEQLMGQKESPTFKGQIEEVLKKQKTSFLSHTDKGTDKGIDMWTFMAPLENTPYFMSVIFLKKELNTLPYRKKIYILLFLTFSLGLLFACGLILKIEYLNPSLLKKSSALFSLVILGNTLLICALQVQSTDNPNIKNNTITSQAALHQFKAVSAARLGASKKGIVYIPTGVFIKSIHVKTADAVHITGYIWQKFLKSAQERLKESDRTLSFGNQLETQWGEISVQDFGSYELRGRSFKSVIQQDFTYTHYPLNLEEITLRIVPPNLGRDVILIPELDAYNPAFAIGVDPQMKVDGWEWEQTYFSYYFYKSPTNFGVGTFSAFPEVPELRFNVLIRRNIGGAFSLNIVVIFLVLILLFGIFVKTTPEHGESYKPLDIYGPCSLLLFNLIIAHSRLRQDVTLAIDKAVYVDQLYFVGYATVTLVVFRFLFFSNNLPLIFLQQNSVLLKSIYWPTLASIIYGVTLFVFW